MLSPRSGLLALAAAAAIVAAVDITLGRIGMPSWLLLAALDEPAHLATAALLLGGVLLVAPAPFLCGVVIGAVAIDVDHIPLVLGSEGITAGTPRPYSHSLPAVLAVVALAAAPTRARPLLLGVAAGLSTHLLRDMATGGLPLLWPLSTAAVEVPYAVYAAALAAGALAAVLAALARPRRGERASKAIA